MRIFRLSSFLNGNGNDPGCYRRLHGGRDVPYAKDETPLEVETLGRGPAGRWPVPLVGLLRACPGPNLASATLRREKPGFQSSISTRKSLISPDWQYARRDYFSALPLWETHSLGAAEPCFMPIYPPSLIASSRSSRSRNDSHPHDQDHV